MLIQDSSICSFLHAPSFRINLAMLKSVLQFCCQTGSSNKGKIESELMYTLHNVQTRNCVEVCSNKDTVHEIGGKHLIKPRMTIDQLTIGGEPTD